MIHFLIGQCQTCIILAAPPAPPPHALPSAPRLPARSPGRALDRPRARCRAAAGAVARHHGLGRRHCAARRGGDAAGADPAAGAVRRQRAADPDERLPPGARRLAGGQAHRPAQPLPADDLRVPPVRAGLSPHLRAARGCLGRRLGPRHRRQPSRRAPAGAARRAALGRVRHPGAGRLRAARPARQHGFSLARHAWGGPHRRARPGQRRFGRNIPHGRGPARLGSRRHRGGLPEVPAPLRRRHRALPPRARRQLRPGAVFRRAHAADPRISPRPAARSPDARGAPAARLAWRRRVCAVS